MFWCGAVSPHSKMGWFTTSAKKGSSGDKYAPTGDDLPPSSDVDGAGAGDDTRSYASGSSKQLLWSPGRSASFADVAQARQASTSGGWADRSQLTSSRLSAFMKGSESRKASLSLDGRRAVLFSSKSKRSLFSSRNRNESLKSLGEASEVTTCSVRSRAKSTARGGPRPS